jgi:hypothetical protein
VISDRTANVVIAVVLTVWVVNVLAAIFKINGYEASESVNAIVTGTVGIAFVAKARVRDDNEKKKDDAK